MKISENIEKITLPGRKRVIRLLDEDGRFAGDGVLLEDELVPDKIVHPFDDKKYKKTRAFSVEELMFPVMKEGKIEITQQKPADIASFVRQRLEQLPDEHQRFEYPHLYKVGISPHLKALRNKLINTKVDVDNNQITNNIGG